MCNDQKLLRAMQFISLSAQKQVQLQESDKEINQ